MLKNDCHVSVLEKGLIKRRKSTKSFTDELCCTPLEGDEVETGTTKNKFVISISAGFFLANLWFSDYVSL